MLFLHFFTVSREKNLSTDAETFPITKQKDITVYGKYLTKELTMSYFDVLKDKIRAVKID